MTTNIQLASNALQLIGDEPISSFADEGVGAKVMGAIYEPTIKALLSSHYWTFTLKKQKLNRLSQTPLNDFQYAFQMPTDSIRILKINPRAFYKIYRDLIYSNQRDIDVDYIFRPDESQWPEYFQLAVMYKLASDAAMAVTDNENKNSIYEEKFRATMAQAFALDSQQNPQVPIVDQPFTDVRNRGFNGSSF